MPPLEQPLGLALGTPPLAAEQTTPEPEPEDEDSEVVFAAMKEEIVGVTKSVMADICDEKGNILKQNISK